ncbi:MAG TPA: MFS transporter [Alphaproteobacteria bacterium]|jgi:sugar phosphate permease
MPADPPSPAAAEAAPYGAAAAAAPYGAARLALVVLVPFAAGYFMSYLYRNINAVVGRYLIDELKLSGADIGLLTAAYFFTFALAQIPLGILLDRFGPRRVNSALLCVAGAGAVLFSFGHDRDALMLARGLVGLGVAGALMSSFQVITLWYPKERWALYNSIIMTVGGLGAVVGTGPVEAALRLTTWRELFLYLGVATVAVAALIFAIVPERARHGRDRDAKPERLGAVIRGVAHVLANPVLWSMAPLLLFSQAANLAILGLWGGLWLRDVAALDRGAAALIVSVMNLGLTAGFVLNAVLSEVAARRKIPLERIMIALTLLFMAAQALIVFRVDANAAWPWFAFGTFANAVIFCYPILAGRLPVAYSGRANTSANFVTFCGAFAGQYAMGWVMDLFPRQAGGGYAAAAYDYAFGGVLALEFLGLLWFVYARRRPAAPAAS